MNVFWFACFASLFLILLTIIQLIVRRRTVARIMILNMITSQLCTILVLIGVLIDEYSLIDMSFIYLLLGPAVMMFVFIYHKFANNGEERHDRVFVETLKEEILLQSQQDSIVVDINNKVKSRASKKSIKEELNLNIDNIAKKTILQEQIQENDLTSLPNTTVKKKSSVKKITNVIAQEDNLRNINENTPQRQNKKVI